MPRPVGVITRGVTEKAFGRTYLSFPLSTLPLLYSLSSLLAFCLQGSPSSLCLCACVAGSSKDNSVVLHTSSSASTVQTGGRGDVAWRALGVRSVQSTTHGSRTRGGSSVQSRSPGRISAIRWRREGGRNGRGRERKMGEGKLKRRWSRRRKQRKDMV